MHLPVYSPQQPWNAFRTAAVPGVDDNTPGKWKTCPQPGFVFLPAGDASLTSLCRKLAHRAGYTVYVRREWGLQASK